MVARAVFLDRDGTINEEVGYLRSPSQVRLLAGAGEAVRLLKEAGWRVIIITNQSGIARGFIDDHILESIHTRLAEQLQDCGAAVDDILFCPHHPDDQCGCRKPETGLLDLARSRFDIDLTASWVVGDKAIDVELGKKAGCRTALVLTGYGPDQLRIANSPDLVAQDLREAAERIVQDVQSDARSVGEPDPE